MIKHPDHVKFKLTSSPGPTGDLAVGGASPGEPVITLGPEHDGAELEISITEGTQWETREGCVYTHASRTLTRGTLVASSTGQGVNFSSAAVVSSVLHSRFAERVEQRAADALQLAQQAVPAASLLGAVAGLFRPDQVSVVEGKIVINGAQAQTVAPTITGTPSVTGTPREGQVVTFSSVSASGTPPPTITYALLLNDVVAVGDVTSGTTLYPAGSAGATPRIRATAANGAAPNAVATSAAGPVVAAPLAAPTITGAAVIIGVPVAGGPVTWVAAAAAGTPAPAITYRPEIDGVLSGTPVVSGAYNAPSDSAGKTLRIAAYAANGVSPDAGPVYSAAVTIQAAAELSPWRSVTAESRLPDARTSATEAGFADKQSHKVGSGDVAVLQIGLTTRNVGNQTAGAAVTYQEMWVTAVSTGVSKRVTWSGSPTATLAPNTLKLLSDDISPADLGFAGGVIPRDSELLIGSRFETTKGQLISLAGGGFNSNRPQAAIWYTPGTTTITGLSGTGNASATGGGSSTTTFNSVGLVVLGRFAGGDKKVFAGVGDSIKSGVSDQLNGGFFRKALYDDFSARSGVRAGIIVALQGSNESLWDDTTHRAWLASWVAYANVLVERYSTNSVVANRTRTQVYNSRKNIWDAFRAQAQAGGLTPYVMALEVGPRTSGTFATLEGQTVVAGWGPGELAEQYNDDAAAAVGISGGVDAFIAPAPWRAAAARSDPNYYKWSVSPVVTTGDGLHPVAAGHDLLAAVLRAAIQSPPSSPTFSSPPSITGTPTAGGVITGTPAVAAGNPAPTVTYALLLDGVVALSSVTLGTTLYPADSAGKSPSLRATASNGINPSAVATSAAGPAIAAPAPANVAPTITAAPVILGMPTAGQLVTWAAATASGTPAPTITYRPEIDGVLSSSPVVSGAYTAPADSAGKTLRIAAYATNGVSPDAGPSYSAAVTIQPAAALSPWRSATAESRLPDGRTSATEAGFANKQSHKVGSGDLAVLQIGLTTRNVGNQNAGAAVTYQEMWVTAVSTGVSKQVTWAGSTTATLAPNTLKLLSDDIAPADLGFTGGVIPRGSELLIGSRFETTKGQLISLAGAGFSSDKPQSSIWYTPGTTTITGLSGTGNVSATGGGSSTTTFNSIGLVVLGRFAGGDKPVFAAVGDIIASGNGDAQVGGFFRRSLYDDVSARSGVRAGIFASGGSIREDIFDDTTHRAWLASWVAYANVLVERFGTNSVGASRARSQVYASRKNIWDAFRSQAQAGGLTPYVMALEVGPRTSGTFATLEGQTVFAGWGPGELAEQYNDDAAAAVGVAGGIDAFVGPAPWRAAAARSDPNHYKWSVSPATTGDGLIPNTAAHTLLAASLQPILQARFA